MGRGRGGRQSEKGGERWKELQAIRRVVKKVKAGPRLLGTVNAVFIKSSSSVTNSKCRLYI